MPLTMVAEDVVEVVDAEGVEVAAAADSTTANQSTISTANPA